MYKLSVFALLCLLSSCSSDDNCDNSYGQPFEIREGRTYCLPEGASVFIEEISESYCPCDANCVWEGEAVVQLRVITSDGEERNAIIHEKRNQDDPSWAWISQVNITETCDPDIETISIVLR